MENKNVGYLILGISFLIVFIIFLFNNAMKKILMQSCPLEHGGVTCPAYSTITQQTFLSFSIVGILIIVSIFLIFSKQSEKVIFKRVRNNQKIKIDVSQLKTEEKKVLDLVQKNKAIFQAELIEKTGFGKAKITRIIDRLEGRGFLERKRRGMTNIVVFKDN